jgi:hypothetical protein
LQWSVRFMTYDNAWAQEFVPVHKKWQKLKKKLKLWDWRDG